MKTPKDLANEHWKWVEGLLDLLKYEDIDFDMLTNEYLYTTAFIHGYKHGYEQAQHTNSSMPAEQFVSMIKGDMK